MFTVKTEFSKFGDLLDKTNKKLIEISNTMSDATRKTRTIERKLKNVEALPVNDEFYTLEEFKNIWTGYILTLEPYKKLPVYNENNYILSILKNILQKS